MTTPPPEDPTPQRVPSTEAPAPEGEAPSTGSPASEGEAPSTEAPTGPGGPDEVIAPLPLKPLGKELARLLAVAAACAVAGLLLAEGALRLFGLPTGATRTVRTAYDVDDATLGPFMAGSSVSISWPPEFPYAATFNSLGCRGSEPRPSEQPPILCVGDSYTFGFGVQDDETWPALLDVKLAASGHPRGVVNLSVGHLTIDDELRYLPRALRELKPSIVILLAPGRGYIDPLANLVVTPHQRSLKRERTRRKGHWLRAAWRRTALFEAQYMSRAYRQRLSLIGSGTLPLQISFPKAEREALNARYEKNLLDMKRLVEASGARFLVATFPHVAVDEDGVARFYEAWTGELARRLGIPCVETTQAFQAAGDPARLLQLPYDLHATPRGNALIADAVAGALSLSDGER